MTADTQTEKCERSDDVEHQAIEPIAHACQKERCSDTCCLISAVFIIFGIFVASAMLNSTPSINARHSGFDDDDTFSRSYTSSSDETSSDDDHVNLASNTTKKLSYDLAMLKMQIERGIVPCTRDEIELADMFFNLTCFRPDVVIDVGCITLRDPATKNPIDTKHFIYIGILYMSQKLQLTIIPPGMLLRESVSGATKTIESDSASIADDILGKLDEIYLRSSHGYFCCDFYERRGLPPPLDCA
jgi:hypothetical protein